MQYEYTVIYRILGISLKEGEKLALLITDPRRGLSAQLTSEVDALALHVDRRNAIASSLLAGLVGHPQEGTFEDRVDRRMAELRQERGRALGEGPFLVINARGTAGDQMLDPKRELEHYSLSLNEEFVAALKEFWERPVADVLAAIVLAARNAVRADRVGDAIVVHQDNGKPLYCFFLSGSATGVLSSPLSGKEAKAAQGWYDVLVANHDLERTWKLLVSSLGFSNDPLRAFLSGWAALEILVNKIFGEYNDRLFAELRRDAQPKAREIYLQRVLDVMKDKYRLNDKFALVAASLNPSEADADFVVFKEAKAIRDQLAHGQDVVDSALPVVETQRLAKKYLHFHLGTGGSAG
jgi:hypothetical protein